MATLDLPSISIVTPSFNQAEFLEECIDSVLSQGYPRLEYVVMDGGSTDGSVEIIRRHEKHLTYWQSVSDGGQYRAINAGFARTTGDVMAWLNSDDKYPPWALLKAGYLFARNPDTEWITGRPLIWNRAGDAEFVHLDRLSHSQARYVSGIYNDPFIEQESTFWRRTLWTRAGGGLNESLRLAADLELWTRFFRSASPSVAEALLGGFRQHGAQKSAWFKDEYDEEAGAILSAERERLAREGTVPSSRQDALSLDMKDYRAIGASLGIRVPDHLSIETLLLTTAVAQASGTSAAEAAERYRMIVRLNEALQTERRRTEWLYSSFLWRGARRLYHWFRAPQARSR